MLGGYGIPAEVGLAAFYRLRDRGFMPAAPPTAHGTGSGFRWGGSGGSGRSLAAFQNHKPFFCSFRIPDAAILFPVRSGIFYDLRAIGRLFPFAHESATRLVVKSVKVIRGVSFELWKGQFLF